ncbi:hypothetical protein B0H13DRAFT_2373979 [Mycena leptocephala]|nr:hypothetical protein B0H13DRAFT_2373979 [Mycena leptocephala]
MNPTQIVSAFAHAHTFAPALDPIQDVVFTFARCSFSSKPLAHRLDFDAEQPPAKRMKMEPPSRPARIPHSSIKRLLPSRRPRRRRIPLAVSSPSPVVDMPLAISSLGPVVDSIPLAVSSPGPVVDMPLAVSSPGPVFITILELVVNLNPTLDEDQQKALANWNERCDQARSDLSMHAPRIVITITELIVDLNPPATEKGKRELTAWNALCHDGHLSPHAPDRSNNAGAVSSAAVAPSVAPVPAVPVVSSASKRSAPMSDKAKGKQRAVDPMAASGTAFDIGAGSSSLPLSDITNAGSRGRDKSKDRTVDNSAGKSSGGRGEDECGFAHERTGRYMKVTTDGHATLDDDDRLGLSAPDNVLDLFCARTFSAATPPCPSLTSFQSLFFDISKQTEQTTILLDTDNTPTRTKNPPFFTLLDVAPCLMWILPPTTLHSPPSVLLPHRGCFEYTDATPRSPTTVFTGYTSLYCLVSEPTLFTLLDAASPSDLPHFFTAGPLPPPRLHRFGKPHRSLHA